MSGTAMNVLEVLIVATAFGFGYWRGLVVGRREKQ